MKKTFVVLGLILTMLSSSIVTFASDSTVKNNVKQPKAKKIVTVGYNLKDREEIFGNMSDEEIDKILQEKVEELMQDKETGFKSTKDEYSRNLDDKLIISVSSKENTNKDKSFEFNNSYKSDNLYEPKAYDEELVREVFSYRVGFPLNGYDGKIYYGNYITVVDGINNRVGSNYIDGITTQNASGVNWPVTDLEPERAHAYNLFYSTIVYGSIYLGQGHFSIDSAAEIHFHGVN